MSDRAGPPWTTRSLLAWLHQALRDRGVEDARWCAEMLLAHTLGCPRLRLYMEADRPASAEERAKLRDLARRALAHEPVQYLVGQASFYGLTLRADRRALIPRPETQMLVDEALRALGGRGADQSDRNAAATPRVADVCTGSGCVAIAIASQAPGVPIDASDVDAAALELAEENIKDHGLQGRITLHRGDLLEALPAEGLYRVIVANPPYIPDHEWLEVAPNVKDYEPTHALRGGRDGLDYVRPIIAQAADRLEPGGCLAIEVASSHAQQALELAQADGRYARCQLLRDFAGHQRVVRAIRA